MALLFLLVSLLSATAFGLREPSAPCCMTQLLHQSQLNASRVDNIVALLQEHSVDQRALANQDYNEAILLLTHAGLADPLELFYVYTALHNDPQKGPCGTGVCAATSKGYACQNEHRHRMSGSVDGVNGVLNELQKEIDDLHQSQVKAVGAGPAYTRWGREDCPTLSRIVYSGVAAGAYHGDSGSGANPLCMPSNPIYSRYSDFQWGAILYPGTYKFQNQNEPYAAGYTNGHAPCAVCEASAQSTTIAMTGTNRCPLGWRREYYGYVLSANFNIDRHSEFLCFDDQIQSSGTVSNYTSAHNFYVVGVDCVHNPDMCPHYLNARELTCAVCSK